MHWDLGDQWSKSLRGSLPDFSGVSDEIMKTLAQSSIWKLEIDKLFAPTIRSLSQLSLGTSRGAPVAKQEPTAYSPEMTESDSIFVSNERIIESFDDLHAAIQTLVVRNPDLQLMWRGQRDATWGLHSSLYRQLMKVNGVRPPNEAHRAAEDYPTEVEMVMAERAILDTARDMWRMDGSSALEIMARLQHFGAPTRLLDVSRNPYIAAWFAVENAPEHNDRDSRLFAMSTFPVLPEAQRPTAAELTQITGETASRRLPFWHYFQEDSDRRSLEWGTGAIRRYWLPPVYEQRILAQNGAFIVDGVPISMTGTASYFKKPNGSSQSWRRADLLASASIYTKVYSPEKRVPINSRRAFPPTFSFRITSSAKQQIRKVLEERFSYSAATLYPDTEGLAQYLRTNMHALLGVAE